MSALRRAAPGSIASLVLLLTLSPETGAAQSRAPVVRDLELTTSEDTEVRGQVAMGQVADLKLKRAPKHGEVALDAASGAFTFRPAKDWNGSDAFALEVVAGSKRTVAKVTLHVTAENDPPQVKPLALATSEDAPAKARGQAFDVDKDILTWRVSAPPAHGSATVDPHSGAVTFNPARDFNGADAFSLEVSDGVEAVVVEVPVTVAAVNDAPQLHVALINCLEDQPCESPLDALDVDHDPLTFKLTAKPKHGELTLEENRVRFVPARDFHGDDAFAVEVSDGKLKAAATLTLRVAEVNDAPVASSLSLSTKEDVPAQGLVTATDVDVEPLVWRVSRPAQHGEASVDPRSGAVSYSPARDFHGDDAFALEVTDGKAPVVVEVPVKVEAVNDAPVAKGGSHALDEDTVLSGQCVADDVDGDALAFKPVRQPAHGTLALDAHGAFSFTPAHDYHGSDSFSFQVSDGKATAEAVVRLAVKPVNDAPVAQPMALGSNEDEPVYGAVMATDVDADPLGYSVSVPPAHGEAKVDPRSGAVSYVPARDYHGDDTFTLAVSDGTASSSAQVSVQLKAVDDAPVARTLDLDASEDTLAQSVLPGADVDGDPLSYRILSQPRLGAAQLTDAATGAWRFQPSTDLNGEDGFTYEVSDGRTAVQGQVKLHVRAVNDAPVAAELALATQEDTAVEGAVQAFDVDRDVLVFAVATQPRLGKATVDAATGALRYEPRKDQYGADTFTVVASDGKLKSAPAKVTVSVAAVNDAPVAAAGSMSTDEDTPARGTVKATDVDGDALTYAVSLAATHGKVEMLDASKGVFSYTPAPNWFGLDSFWFTTTDPSGASSVAEVKMNVAAVNDPPMAEGDHVNAPCNGRISGRLRGFDRESKTVSFRIVEEPKRGRLKLVDAATGEFTFDIESTDGEPIPFSFAAFDGQALSEPAEQVVHPQGSCVRGDMAMK